MAKRIYRRLEQNVMRDLHNCCLMYFELKKLSEKCDLNKEIDMTLNFALGEGHDCLNDAIETLQKAMPKVEEEKKMVLNSTSDLSFFERKIRLLCDQIHLYRDLFDEDKIPAIYVYGEEERGFLQESFDRLFNAEPEPTKAKKSKNSK